MLEIGDFFQKKGESWRAALRHAVWNDGRNPRCTQSAQGIAKLFGYGEVGAGTMICAGIPGCVPAILSGTGFLVGVATGEAVGACKQAIEDYAAQNIGDH